MPVHMPQLDRHDGRRDAKEPIVRQRAADAALRPSIGRYHHRVDDEGLRPFYLVDIAVAVTLLIGLVCIAGSPL
jgi:hypothetical protein